MSRSLAPPVLLLALVVTAMAGVPTSVRSAGPPPRIGPAATSDPSPAPRDAAALAIARAVAGPGAEPIDFVLTWSPTVPDAWGIGRLVWFVRLRAPFRDCAGRPPTCEPLDALVEVVIDACDGSVLFVVRTAPFPRGGLPSAGWLTGPAPATDDRAV